MSELERDAGSAPHRPATSQYGSGDTKGELREELLRRASKAIRSCDSGDSVALLRLDSILVEMYRILGEKDPDVIRVAVEYIVRQRDDRQSPRIIRDSASTYLAAREVLGPVDSATVRARTVAALDQVCAGGVTNSVLHEFRSAVLARLTVEAVPKAGVVATFATELVGRMLAGDELASGTTIDGAPPWLCTDVQCIEDCLRYEGTFGPFWVSYVLEADGVEGTRSHCVGPFRSRDEAAYADPPVTNAVHDSLDFYTLTVHQFGPHDCVAEAVPIIHGLPGPELIERAARGEVSLGGCMALGDSQCCRVCGNSW